MVNKIQIDNKELLVLLEFKDSKYDKITLCLDEKDKKVFVINNKIVTDQNIISEIKQKYHLELPQKYKGSIF